MNLIVKNSAIKDKEIFDKLKSELSFLFSIEENKEINDKIEIEILGEDND